jgi:hypothetical protein
MSAKVRMESMKEHDFFTDHYDVFLIASNIGLMAIVIFFMALSVVFQISLFVASALFLVFLLHSNQSKEPPCGATLELEGIARPRPGFEPHKE